MNRFNTIYYRFKSEKKKYSINFETTELSIGDIKKIIIKRRNMEKTPEKFELIFYDENMNKIYCDDNYKVEPLRLLIIKRLPWYKVNNSFTDLMVDHKDIITVSDESARHATVAALATIKPIDPLILEATKKMNQTRFIEDYSCPICKSIETEPLISLCCSEMICRKCLGSKVPNDKCPFCNKVNFEFKTNLKFKELRDMIIRCFNNNAAASYKQQSEEPGKEAEAISAGASRFPMIGANETSNEAAHAHAHAHVYPSSATTALTTHISAQTKPPSHPHAKFFEDARFFVIKSSNKDNVDTSQAHNEWATTVTNQKKLNEAFQEHNVILIFSVNKSGFFQGYAAMTSYITDKITNIWTNESNVKLGGTFNVQWLSTCELPFNKIKNLTNPLNNNEPVIKSRDTQELPHEIGEQLCQLCYEQEKYETQFKNKRFHFDNERIPKILEEIKINKERIYNVRGVQVGGIGALQPEIGENLANPNQFNQSMMEMQYNWMKYMMMMNNNVMMNNPNLGKDEEKKEKDRDRDRAKDVSRHSSVKRSQSRGSKHSKYSSRHNRHKSRSRSRSRSRSKSREGRRHR